MPPLLKLGAVLTICVCAHAQERDREEELGRKLVMVRSGKERKTGISRERREDIGEI